MMRCFSCVSRRVSPGSTGKSATVTSPTPNRAIEQRDVACDAELPTARQLSDSREETAKDRNVPLINRVARVPHERQTDGGFGANAAHHGDPFTPLDATLNPSPGPMCPIWQSRGSVNNRGNHCTCIREIPQKSWGRAHAAVARVAVGANYGRMRPRRMA